MSTADDAMRAQLLADFRYALGKPSPVVPWVMPDTPTCLCAWYEYCERCSGPLEDYLLSTGMDPDWAKRMAEEHHGR